MATKFCAIDGCERPADRRARLCAAHARRKQRGQPLLAPIKQKAHRIAADAKCAVEGCQEVVYSRSHCRVHYQQLRIRGAVHSRQEHLRIGDWWRPRKSSLEVWIQFCESHYQWSQYSDRSKKQCNQCGNLKSAVDFHGNGRLRDGSMRLASRCKLCCGILAARKHGKDYQTREQWSAGLEANRQRCNCGTVLRKNQEICSQCKPKPCPWERLCNRVAGELRSAPKERDQWSRRIQSASRLLAMNAKEDSRRVNAMPQETQSIDWQAAVSRTLRRLRVRRHKDKWTTRAENVATSLRKRARRSPQLQQN